MFLCDAQISSDKESFSVLRQTVGDKVMLLCDTQILGDKVTFFALLTQILGDKVTFFALLTPRREAGDV